MNRDEKAAAVKEITASLNDADSVFAFDYRGISVAEGAELRERLREADTTFKVIKNRLAKLALSDSPDMSELDELLSGPTAMAFVGGDPVTAAKALFTFAREHNGIPAYKGGLMDGAQLDADSFATIARLPSLDVLHGQLVAMTASPITGLARGLGQMIGGLAQQLNQIAEQGLVTGTDPSPPADEAPAAATSDSGPPEEAADGASEDPAAEGDLVAPEGEAKKDGSAGPAEDSESETDPDASGSEAEEANGKESEN